VSEVWNTELTSKTIVAEHSFTLLDWLIIDKVLKGTFDIEENLSDS